MKTFMIAAVLLSSSMVAMAAGPADIPSETKEQRDARMAWWREARFGMFIHWGLYSQLAGQWNGRDIPGLGEWIMNKAEIPAADYARAADTFNPVKFNADAWVRVAKSAGVRYIVITAKHHDGFAMFDSAVSPFQIARATPFKRDPLKELSTACAKQGMKLGFYYSQSQDWHHPGGAGNFWDPAVRGDYDSYLDQVAVPQVRELLTRYGPVAVLWYDTPRHMTDTRARKFLPLHALQPGLIVNNRLRTAVPGDDSMLGDTETPEQFIPPSGYPGKDWETCMTMNDTWGFKKSDTNWKGAEEILHNLSDIAGKGGNFLLNIGPTAEGEIPQASIVRLAVVGAWLKRNGQAVYGTQAGPFPRSLPWGRTTRRAHTDGTTTLYLHIWQRPADGKIVLPGMHDKPLHGKPLAGGATLATEDSAEGLVVVLPEFPADEIMPVVSLDFPGPVSTSQSLPAAGDDGCIMLRPDDAVLSGPPGNVPGIVAGAADGIKVINLARPPWKIQYAFVTPAERLWKITAEVSPGAYNRLTVAAPGPSGRSITAALQAWGGGVGDFTTVDLGFLPLPAGTHALEFKSEMDDLRPLQIRRVWLSPAGR